MQKETIILLHETGTQSWRSDVGTLLMFVAMASVSKWVGNGTFSALAAVMFLYYLVSTFTRSADRSRLTFDQARKRIDEIEAALKESSDG